MYFTYGLIEELPAGAVAPSVYMLMPTRRIFVRRKRADFHGWNIFLDLRTKFWRH
jgi:hypothetical protein